MPGLDAWIEGDGLCSYCGQRSCVCQEDEPEDDICDECVGEGFVVADCFEDTCCCADPEIDHGVIRCPKCHGRR